MNKITKYLKGFLIQIQFLTRIPLFIKINFDEECFAGGIIFAPIIGFLIGALLIPVYLITNIFNNMLITSVVIVFVELIITGGLHIDGLADTCDGFFSGRPKEKILEIMKDSRIGTNGAIGIIMVIIFKIIFLYSIDKNYFIQTLLIFPMLGRLNIIWSAGLSKYARESKGMGSKITELTGLKQIIISSIICLLPGLIISQIKFVLIFLITISFAVLFTLYSKKKIGGVTGDIFGAVIEITEVIVLCGMFIIGKIFINPYSL